MTTDLRALCAELVEELENWIAYGDEIDIANAHVMVDRARTALAQPAPPADKEVAELVAWLRGAGAYREALHLLGASISGELRTAPALLTRAADLLERLPEGPAVQSREPASVDGQPSDEEIAEWADACDEAPLEELDPEVHGWRRCFTPQEFSETVRAALARWGNPAPRPIPVTERLPEASTKVLAHYFNDLGNGRTICAIWVPAKSRSEDYDLSGDDFTEYDEEDDKFYWPEGWYEAIENWDELGWVKVYEGEVIYWQPLPQWPAHALPLPSAEVE